ncbi:MAG TPA: acyl-CoA desaturase [Solirubrobacteraceae bacterium]|nr:acyl-CoA desaturase [Solirubrobacteraceae bacterium]
MAATATPKPEPMIESPLSRLSQEQIDALAKEFDAIHDEVFADLGTRDRKYITSMIEMHRRMVVGGRVVLFASPLKPAWLFGTSLLSLAKILENMEIGHNVMHGQWDWMNDPDIHSSSWDWDTASTKEAWKHSHNYVHHTYTNIRGKDKDLGYEIMRIDPHQKWHPVYLAQPLYNLLLMAFFEWGVAFHDLDLEAIRKGEKSQKEVRQQLKGMGGKAIKQIAKDYVAFPAISGLANAAVAAATKGRGEARGGFLRGFRSTLKANVSANIVRNLWSHAIIFCGHFPDQAYTFAPDEVEDESRGGFYVRQLLGAVNIEGSPLFHVISGNLGYQVEHHLYPDMPSTRYAEIAPRVKEICERYELPYNSGPFLKQWIMVNRTIARLAFPGGEPRPKPGPYHGIETNGSGPAKTPDVHARRERGEHASGPEQDSDGVRVDMPEGS